MQGEKDLLFSRATIGAIVLLVALFAEKLGFDIGDQQTVVEAIMGLIGAVMVVIGRVKAVKRISSVAGVKINNKAPMVAVVCFLFAGILIGLGGCATMPAAETPKQKIAYAESTLTGLVNSAATLLTQGLITKEEAIAFRDKADEAHQGVLMARNALKVGNPQTSLEYLQTVNVLLLELRQFLDKKEGQNHVDSKRHQSYGHHYYAQYDRHRNNGGNAACRQCDQKGAARGSGSERRGDGLTECGLSISACAAG